MKPPLKKSLVDLQYFVGFVVQPSELYFCRLYPTINYYKITAVISCAIPVSLLLVYFIHSYLCL